MTNCILKSELTPAEHLMSRRQLRQIHRQVVKTPIATSRQVFHACDMPNVCRATRCKALRKVASVMNAVKTATLNNRQKTKRIEGARQHMLIFRE